MKHGVNDKEDLTDFIQFRLSQLNISDVSYSAIDFCEGKDDANRIKNFLNQYDGICIDSWETSAYIHSSHDTIWLPEAMDSGRIWSTTPLLFYAIRWFNCWITITGGRFVSKTDKKMS